MIPYYQQPRLQTHHQPQQSQGFQPTQLKPRVQQTLYTQTAQPPAAPFSQPYQSHPQYRQSRPAQYFTQQPSQQFTPQRRYAPHSAPQPNPIAVHQAPATYTPSQPIPSRNTHPHIQSYPSTPPFSYPQPRPGPIIPPIRANSQSPDKTRRPLPDPSATTGVARPRPTSMPPTYAPVPGVQAHPRSAYPSHTSPQASTSSIPMTQPPSQTQPFQIQSQNQSPSAPQLSYKPIPHNQITPNNVQSAQASSHTVESTASRRPLPSLPGESAPSHSSQPVTPSHSQPSPAATPSSPRRTLPFSPTQSPSVMDGMKARAGTFALPKRSSTLPTASNDTIERPGPSDVRHSSDVSEHPVVRISRQTIPAPNPQPSSSSTPAQSAPAPSPSRAPRTQQTQSLAFRLASLSLHEERTHKPPAKRALPAGNRTQFKPNSASPLARPGRSAIDLDDTPPPPSIRLPTFGMRTKPASMLPSRPPVPTVILPGEDEEDEDDDEDDEDDDDDEEDDDDDDTDILSTSTGPGPSITVSGPSVNRVSHPPAITFSETPSFTVSEPPAKTVPQGPYFTVSEATPSIMVSEMQAFSSTSSTSSIPDIIVADLEGTLQTSASGVAPRRKGLICYGCGRGIVGRIVSAMGGRWHPACFKCMVCGELLEHVSSYEHDGRPYCHLDYHEKFAPQCYHCRTPIVDERFITLDDPALGKRTYHEQHFFCAECGDPFLAPTIPRKGREASPDGEAGSLEDDVGFTVFKGHPYCESCHVRLRYPKCKRCKKSIRDGMQAVEALGGKWCWECFLCAGCEKPFDDPAFFQRDNKAYCEPCFSLIIRNEI